MGKGLAPAFELAIGNGKPVLTTVSEAHREALRAFAPQTIFLNADGAALQKWWEAVQTPTAHRR